MASPVPYQAYRSKRHSLNLSNTQMSPNVTPPPVSQPPAAKSSPKPQAIRTSLYLNGSASPLPMAARDVPAVAETVSVGSSSSQKPLPPTSSRQSIDSVHAPTPKASEASSPLVNGSDQTEASGSGSRTQPLPQPLTQPSQGNDAPPRRASTFRHVPLRKNVPSARLTLSPLHPANLHARSSSASSNHPRQAEQYMRAHSASPSHRPIHPSDRITSDSPRYPDLDGPLPPIPLLDPPSPGPGPREIRSRSTSLAGPSSQRSSPAPTPLSVSPAPSSSASTLAPAIMLSNLSLSSTLRPSARYRPGFQPKGVYRPLTDDFVSLRRSKSSANKIEQTKLERRLEKLIQLHFRHDDKGERPAVHNRRASSIFDFDLSDPAALWRGVVNGGRADIRAAEQRITPWQEDADVSRCPLCLATFHPLTNRKHHCRLCGRIVCSLPVKHPQRSATCSLLFIYDPKTGAIEEVDEGVDYGVRRQTSTNGKSKQSDKFSDDDKFLRGVRICRECRPALSRQQYQQEALRASDFVRLHEAFALLEKEIEDALPQFQELLLTLNGGNDERPTKAAASARKRLLDSFRQYDALSKRIRHLPCPGGLGSSQDRVQQAVMTRANLFLQKNMFPLQSLPKLKTAPLLPNNAHTIDPDSQLAHTLQPLLEQEALLESYVEEAKARRKFEDAKTLSLNLTEIRAEIERVVRSGDGDPVVARNGAG